MSNFSGKGPVRVASQPNTLHFEVFDMAGNAREWCLNQVGAARAIGGGSWTDHVYMALAVTQAPPFDRSERNGFRCMRVPDRAAVPDRMYAPIPSDPTPPRDVAKEHPVGDAVFAAYKQQFAYDRIPLDPRMEGRAVGEAWVRERVSFTAAYGGERVVGQLFLPTNARPPYQVVVNFPGITAHMDTGSSDLVERAFEFSHHLAFLLKNGRAVLYPVLKGTHERRATMPLFFPETCNDTHEYAAYQRQLVQDVSRTIDYLETRPDIDRSRLAYIGWSWGGHRAGLVLAVESRFKTAIIEAGGIRPCRVLPEVDPLNFVPRVTIPVLMMHGRWDTQLPWERDGKPMYDLLGTPPADKVLKLYDTDHFIPRSELIKESLAWLDKHLGPVSR